MPSRKLILVGGGTRSGKSGFALQLARQLGQRRLFLATAQDLDDEMSARIARHRRERGADFMTLEEPLAVPEAIRHLQDQDVVVVDCLTLWLANLLLAGQDPEAIGLRVAELVEALATRSVHAVVVTNEVGMGIVPESALGRTFRDVAGTSHQKLSRAADEVYVALLGTMLRIKPTLGLAES